MAEIAHHSEETIVAAILRRLRQSSTCRVAVAYAGSGAYRFFPASPGTRPPDLRIAVDASDGVVKQGLTNPKGLERLLGFTSQLRSLSGLHAKVFIFDETAAIVGSANLSESSITHQYQMALEVSDREVILQLITWFDSKIWKLAQVIDSSELERLIRLAPSRKHVFTGAKTKGKFLAWRGETPQPPLESSDFSINISDRELQELLKQFASNRCEYSAKGESCLQMANQVESIYAGLGRDFHELMGRRDSWKREDLEKVFDLAYTNGKHAKINKPRFFKLSPTVIAKGLEFLLIGPGDPFAKFEKMLPGNSYHLPGLGEVGLIFLMHLWSPTDFAVMNAPIEKALTVLKVIYRRKGSTHRGQVYKNQTSVIREIAMRTDLGTFSKVDHFLDAIGKRHIGLPKTR